MVVTAHHRLFLPLLLRDRSPSLAPVWGSSRMVLHELLQCESIPWAADLHELLQGGSLSTGCSRSGAGCSCMDPPWGPKSWHQTCSSLGSSLHRSPGPCQQHAPAWASHRGHSLLWAPTCSSLRLLNGLQWHSCLTILFTTGCRGIPALVPGAPPAPYPSLTLVSAELFLPHILTPLWPQLLLCNSFLKFLKGGGGTTTITDGFSLCQRWVYPGAGWH